MMNIAEKRFPGLAGPRAGETAASPFELACACGTVLRGQRQALHQVIRCPTCAANRFVLPRSPLPEILVKAKDAPKPGRRSPLIWMAVSGAVVAAVLGMVAFVGVVVFLSTPKAKSLSDEEHYQDYLNAGRSALTEGAPRKAGRELAEALRLADRGAVKPPAVELRRLRQEQRQATLVGDLLSESLTEIVRQSVGLNEGEWNDIFQQRYASRSVILDDVLHRDAQGRYHHQLAMQVVNTAVKVDLGRLKILRDLPLHQPQVSKNIIRII